MLDAILDTARLENRRVTLYESVFDARAALRQAVRMIDAEREAAGLVLAVDTPSQGVLLRADERPSRQIVLNLLSNAIRFTQAGGTVCVTLDRDADGLRSCRR